MTVTETKAKEQKGMDGLNEKLGVPREDAGPRVYPTGSWRVQVFSNLAKYFTNCLRRSLGRPA